MLIVSPWPAVPSTLMPRARNKPEFGPGMQVAATLLTDWGQSSAVDIPPAIWKTCCFSVLPYFCGSRICTRSEEHTSELQSHVNLVCRLLLEKKKKSTILDIIYNKIQDTTHKN